MRGAFCDKHMMHPNLSLQKKGYVLYFELHCAFCFVVVSFDCVFPIAEQVIKCNCSEVRHSLVEGSCKAMSAFVD